MLFLLLLILGISISSSSPRQIQYSKEQSPKTSAPLDYVFETGWWKFDEGIGSNTVDSAGGNQNGTIFEATWTSNSKIGSYALDFDGVDDYVDIDYNLPNTDYTMCVWYKTLVGGKDIIAEGLSGESISTNVQELILFSDTEIGIRTETGSGTNHDYKFTPGNIVDGQWHFAAAVITSGNLVFYWDDQKFTSSMINTDTTADNCWIGASGGPFNGWYFDGSIDDVRIYEFPLSEGEISWLYNNGSGREEKLNEHDYKIGWWKLDEGTGSIAEDSIDGDQNGTISGAVWTSDSKLGDYALNFDGVDDYVDIDYNLPNTDYTMCVWYKTLVGGKDIIAEGLSGESISTNVQELILFSDTEIGIRTETGSGTNHDYKFTPGNIVDGQWHFAAAVITSGNLVFYWDDQKFTSSMINTDTTADNCWIGASGGPFNGWYFDGSIDDVRIYERILSDTEIAWIYNNGEGSIPPEITIDSPTIDEVIGSIAPGYDISISGFYDSIWYTLDGGTTNITASGLTGTLNQAAWTALPDGIITINFFANYSAELEGTAQVQVIKDSSEEPPPPGIPSYDLYILIGALSVISALLIRKRAKS